MNARNSRGFSLIELLIVVAIILIISAIAIPNILRARMAADESAAAANLKNIRDSQGTYLTTYGSAIGFADTLAKLGPGSPCNELHSCLQDSALGCAAAPCSKTGYLYYLVSSSSTFPIADYTTTATPIGWAQSGQRNMCANEDGVLRQQIAPTGSLPGALTHNVCGNAAQYTPVQ